MTVSDSLLITFDHPDGLAIEIHDGPALCAKYNFAVPFPDCLIVLCTRHQQMVPVKDNPNSLHEEAAKHPEAWCAGCKASAPPVVLAPPPPVQPEPVATIQVDEGVYVEPPADAVEAFEASLQEAPVPLPAPAEAAPSVPLEEPALAAAAPPTPTPKAAPKPAKSTTPPPKDLIESVMVHYRNAKATVAALEAQLEAAKNAASDCLQPLTAYAPSWEYKGEWYIVAAVKGGRTNMRGPMEKRPGRPAASGKEEG